MDRKKLDDALHALGQTFAFFNKDLDELQIAVWKSFLLKHDPEVMMKAMQMHMECGRYAPKPKDLSDLAEQILVSEKASKPPARELPQSNCPEEISDAWRWALKVFHGSELYESAAVDDETAERYLNIVNREAQRTGILEAIPEKFRISL